MFLSLIALFVSQGVNDVGVVRLVVWVDGSDTNTIPYVQKYYFKNSSLCIYRHLAFDCVFYILKRNPQLDVIIFRLRWA